ncbi:cell division protein ZapE [Eikenella sp. Marseille-P7795]|uniref:cell division protein ZapE n=1 Tax=Eikenella sp. Marseille-P7795 TaxID=2866577 RepID=UPI001CE4724B|nr:cell division protein ZapE [Eikenella sp. Marseille-P7795]
MTAFTPPPFAGHSPLSWYQAAAQQPGFIRDAAQETAVRRLDRLWHELAAHRSQRGSLFGKLFGKKAAPPKGLYFYGGVGRGKSFLMDAFHGCLPPGSARRAHFHAFMAEAHRRMREHKNQTNPLQAVARDIAREAQVLCFDEFHVSDIADAMILGRLLEGLLAEGIVLVATSNYEPAGLYPQGQNRSSFLPTIALLERSLDILNVDSGQDYRQRSLTPADIFFISDDARSEEQLAALFARHTGQAPQAGTLPLLGRQIPTQGQADGALWFHFDALCRGPRSQADYLALAEQNRMIFVSHIPKLGESEHAEARRLTWLIDVLYDYRVKLSASLAAPPEQLYTRGSFAHEFVRSASRLTEMQSEAYLALPHLTLDKEAT